MSADRNAADEYFRRLVRARGRCIGCGETRYDKLQTCHILSRKYGATRCDLLNAVCGCGSCHARWGGDPPLFAEVLREWWESEHRSWPAQIEWCSIDGLMAYLRERRDKGSDGLCDELGIPKSHWWRHERERLKALCAAQGLETRL